MKKRTIEQRKENSDKDPNGDEWITIGYDQIPKETFDRYGAKPFRIMRRKMRNDKGEVWSNISWSDAKAEAEKLGLRLLDIPEHLVILDFYVREKGKNASIYDADFLGIEELKYDEKVPYEWVNGPSPFLRGGYWYDGSIAGAGTLGLYFGPSLVINSIGFRCAR